MPANRFFIHAEYKKGLHICLEGLEHHHLAHVMRLTDGETVELVNGKGDLAKAKILEVKKKETTLQILEIDHYPQIASSIFLAIPLMKGSKLEWVIEKGVELGADSFFIYVADHSEKETLSSHQLERLHSIAISSLKQSGRLYLPSIEIISNLTSLLKKEASFLFGDPNSTNFISGQTSFPTLLITGPEKGFSEKELSLLKEQAKAVRFSAYTLRAETAPIAALSILAVDRMQKSSSSARFELAT